MAKQENQPRQQDEPKLADDLGKVPNPPIQELSDEQLDKVSGGALDPYLKIQGKKTGNIDTASSQK